MPKIKFTATPKLPADLKHLGYAKGMEINADADWCERWVRRDVAVYVNEPVAPAAAPASVAVEVIEATADEVEHTPVIEPEAAPEAEVAIEDAAPARRGRPRK